VNAPAEMNVTDIPRPWEHEWGTVVDIEYPGDQPHVVHLIFSNSDLKGVETRTAVYARQADGRWQFARLAPTRSQRGGAS
jgi:hypothetical protein